MLKVHVIFLYKGVMLSSKKAFSLGIFFLEIWASIY